VTTATQVANVKRAWRHPDEGGTVSDDDTKLLRGRFDSLEATQRAWIAGLVRQAKRHHCGFHMYEQRTVRRYEIYRGLILLAQEDCVDDDVRVLVGSVMDSDVPHWPEIATGHAVGALDHIGAAEFARLADRYCTGDVVGTVIGHGDSAWLKVA
jgi:hypothetical protein